MKKVYEKMSGAQLGSWFEGKIADALKALKKESHHHLLFHRLQDTKAAGSFLPEQPADFFLGCPRGAFLVEAKASFAKQSLTSCLSSAVSGGQAAAAKLWCRTGPHQHSLFVFFCAESETVELWDGLVVAERFIAPGARLIRAERWLSGPLTDLKPMLREVLL